MRAGIISIILVLFTLASCTTSIESVQDAHDIVAKETGIEVVKKIDEFAYFEHTITYYTAKQGIIRLEEDKNAYKYALIAQGKFPLAIIHKNGSTEFFETSNRLDLIYQIEKPREVITTTNTEKEIVIYFTNINDRTDFIMTVDASPEYFEQILFPQNISVLPNSEIPLPIVLVTKNKTGTSSVNVLVENTETNQTITSNFFVKVK